MKEQTTAVCRRPEYPRSLTHPPVGELVNRVGFPTGTNQWRLTSVIDYAGSVCLSVLYFKLQMFQGSCQCVHLKTKLYFLL